MDFEAGVTIAVTAQCQEKLEDGHPWELDLPSGKHTKSYRKSPFLMGKLTINGHFQ